MAGPLSSEEIEDVVSSVRRLVSNEQRTLSRDLNAERLLLTPAFRVVPETSPLSPLMLDVPLVDAPAFVAPAPVDDLTPAQEDSLAQALAQDVGPDALAVDAGEGTLVAEAPFVDTATVEAEWEDEIWADPGIVSLGEAALAADEAEVLTPPETAAPVAEVVADVVADTGAAAADGPWVEDQPIPFVPLRRRAEHLAARVAAGEVGDPGHAAEPDSTAMTQDEPAAAPVAGTAQQPDMPQMASDLYDADGTPLAVLDETALNEIVRQVLRAELQGELGERITRNVRKLVRAEINRALLARDLD